MKVINLTPHAVRLLPPGGEEVIIPPSGMVCRVAVTPRQIGVVRIDGREMPAVATRYGALEGLPEPKDWWRFIVSGLAQQAACWAGRHDTLVPSDLVRDAEGRVVGARALQACCYQAVVEFPAGR